MNNKIITENSAFETLDEVEYEELIKQRDHFVQMGDRKALEKKHSNTSQAGFATGLILGISAGIAFVICIIVLYLLGIINL